MWNAVLIATAIILLSAGTATAQVERAELNQALAALERAADALGPGRAPQLLEAVRWLRGRTTMTNPAQVSRPYLQTLVNAARLLDGTPSAATIDDVTEEIAAKVEHCQALGIGMGGSVVLRVNTRRGSNSVNNWQVFYLLKIYERATGASPSPFATLSAPAETRLAPGRYWVWARDPSTGRTSERSLLTVAGRQEFTFDLPVP
jgi:hypothetical protein